MSPVVHPVPPSQSTSFLGPGTPLPRNVSGLRSPSSHLLDLQSHYYYYYFRIVYILYLRRLFLFLCICMYVYM
jgi:hypothetical protein